MTELTMPNDEMSVAASAAIGEAHKRQDVEVALSVWASSIRPSFESRREFNHEVMARLAKAGHTPTAAAVKRIGGWGQNVSIAEDVESWYRNLADRLDARDARIPPAAQAHANTLIETLWRSAYLEVEQRFAETLRQELGASKLRNDRSEHVAQTLQRQVDELGQQCSQYKDIIDQEAVKKGEELLARLTTDALHENLVSELRQKVNIAAENQNRLILEHASALATAQDKYAAETANLRRLQDTEKAEAIAVKGKAADDLRNLENNLQAAVFELRTAQQKHKTDGDLLGEKNKAIALHQTSTSDLNNDLRCEREARVLREGEKSTLQAKFDHLESTRFAILARFFAQAKSGRFKISVARANRKFAMGWLSAIGAQSQDVEIIMSSLEEN